MSIIDESALPGKIRDRPINDKLRRVLHAAADEAGIERVFVVSGGQPGTSGRRTGSTRHDGGNAADLQLIRNGRKLDFTRSDDLPIISDFVTSAAANGATGIGAGLGYMGPYTLHVGFGRSPDDHKELTWGEKGASANAPSWLRQAAAAGWHRSGDDHGTIPDEAWAHVSTEEDTMSMYTDVQRFRPMLDFIARHEGTAGRPGGGYNTSLGFGAYLPGGRERDLTSMTLDEIDALQVGMLHNPRNHFNSSALGRYQIVRKTLIGLRRQLGLSGSETFSPQLQDRLGVALIQRRGGNAIQLGQEWASLKNVSASQIMAAYNDTSDAGRVTTYSDPTRSAPGGIPPELWTIFLDFLKGTRGVGGDGAQDWPTLEMGARGEGVERLQKVLNDLNYFTGGVDGKFGPLTRGAVALFQLENQLQPVTGVADAQTWAALTKAGPRALPAERVTLTPDDLRKLGSTTIKNADRTRYAGWLTGLLGAAGLTKSASGLVTGTTPTPTAGFSPEALIQVVTGLRGALGGGGNQNINQALDTIQQALRNAAPVANAAQPAAAGSFNSLIDMALPLLSGLLPGGTGSLLALGLGFAFHQFGTNIINQRVANQRDGRTIGSRFF